MSNEKDGQCRKHCRGACRQHCREILHQTPGGDGDVNLADVWPMITKVGAEPEAGRGWRVRVAPPGGMRVATRRVREAALKLDRPIVRVLGVHDDGGVSRYQA